MFVVIKSTRHEPYSFVHRIEFESKEQADKEMPSIMEEICEMFGSSGAYFIGFIEGSDEELETRWSDWSI
jgi:hypothetical protein